MQVCHDDMDKYLKAKHGSINIDTQGQLSGSISDWNMIKLKFWFIISTWITFIPNTKRVEIQKISP